MGNTMSEQKKDNQRQVEVMDTQDVVCINEHVCFSAYCFGMTLILKHKN